MATVNQLVRKPRARKVAKSNVPALEACPQKTWRMYSCIYYHSKNRTPRCVKYAVFV